MNTDLRSGGASTQDWVTAGAQIQFVVPEGMDTRGVSSASSSQDVFGQDLLGPFTVIAEPEPVDLASVERIKRL